MKLENVNNVITRSCLFAATVLVVTPLSCFSADLTWNLAGDGNWNTTDLNWDDGGSAVAWSNGNAAIFDGFSTFSFIDVDTDIVATSLTRNSINGTSTFQLLGFSIDVPTITTTGDGSIDMAARLTGNHDLVYTGDSTTTNGRLNLQVQADYTGDTFLTNRAYLTSGVVSDALPTTTTLNMTTNTTFRIIGNNRTQEIAGLDGAGTIRTSSTGQVFTINTKSGVSTAFNGTIRDDSSALSLIIAGAGTQSLSGNFSLFDGTITASGGTLVLGSSPGSIIGVTVNGGDLQSNTSNINLGIGGVNMSSGSITPNGVSSAGTFTLAADQDFTATGGTLNFDVGTDLDQILGSGSGTFSIENLTISLSLGTGFDYNNDYALFSGFASGSASSIGVTGFDMTNWAAGLDASSGDLVLSFTAIPEPSTWAFVFGAMVGAIILCKRSLAKRS